ncbi:hypothetical protein PMAYCL1PPCAC_17473, partial [Pristionchus mayeri]
VSAVLLTTLIFLSYQSPLPRLVPECSNFGYFGHDKTCVCLQGTKGDKCNEFNATRCVNGHCTAPETICHFENIDCLYTHHCQDKSGWCLPLNFAPNSLVTTTMKP